MVNMITQVYDLENGGNYSIAGIVKRNIDDKTFEIIWVNEGLASRFALVDMAKAHRLEVISSADQQSV